MLHVCEAFKKLDDTAAPHTIVLGQTEEQILAAAGNTISASQGVRKIFCRTKTTMLEHKMGQAFERGGSNLDDRVSRYIGLHEEEVAPWTKGEYLVDADVNWRSVMYKPMKDDIEKVLPAVKEKAEKEKKDEGDDDKKKNNK